MSCTSGLLFPHLGQPGSKLPLWTMQKLGVCAPLGLESYGGQPRKRLSSNTYIFPAQCGLAAFAENVSYRVESCEQEALFSWPTTHVDPVSGNKDPAHSRVALSVPTYPEGFLPGGRGDYSVRPFRISTWAFFDPAQLKTAFLILLKAPPFCKEKSCRSKHTRAHTHKERGRLTRS